jgi:carbon storage regulator
MLVLTRCHDESIVIGGNIVIKVVAIKGDRVRLGVLAPRDVTVHRGEVQRTIDARLARTESQQNGTPKEETVTRTTADSEIGGSPATGEG